MILFVGQVGTDCADREAFQEIDYRRMFGGIAKWAAQIDRVERMPEYVAQAYRVALAGSARAGGAGAAGGHAGARAEVADAPPHRAMQARRPARRTSPPCRRCSPERSARWCWSAAAAGIRDACAALAAFAHASALPVALRLPPPGPVRQPRCPAMPATSASASIPQLARARPRSRRAAGDRRAAGRDDHVGLLAARGAGAAAGAGPRPSVGATSWAACSSRRSRSPRRPGAFLAAMNALPARPARGWPRGRGRRPRRVRGMAGAAAGAGRRRPLADRPLARRARCPTTRS